MVQVSEPANRSVLQLQHMAMSLKLDGPLEEDGYVVGLETCRIANFV